jgi:hypothetical protein
MDKQAMAVRIVTGGWQAQVSALDSILGKLSDEQLDREISSSRNRGIYLLGHLTAVNDLMLPLLRFGEAIYPELQPIFVDAADKTVTELPPARQLREQWKTVNGKLQDHIKVLTADEWFLRHANISAEDFVREPHRNRLNVLLGRANHLSYHRGQFILLTNKS